MNIKFFRFAILLLAVFGSANIQAQDLRIIYFGNLMAELDPCG